MNQTVKQRTILFVGQLSLKYIHILLISLNLPSTTETREENSRAKRDIYTFMINTLVKLLIELKLL